MSSRTPCSLFLNAVLESGTMTMCNLVGAKFVNPMIYIYIYTYIYIQKQKFADMRGLAAPVHNPCLSGSSMDLDLVPARRAINVVSHRIDVVSHRAYCSCIYRAWHAWLQVLHAAREAVPEGD